MEDVSSQCVQNIKFNDVLHTQGVSSRKMQYTDSDGIFIEKAIEQETNEELKKALIDLDEFMFG